MTPFDAAVMFETFDVWAMALILLIGATLGVSIAVESRHFSISHLYRVCVAGALFFVPLALMRAFDGSPTWERLLGTCVQWWTFGGAIWAGNRCAWRLWLRRHRP
jgi:hypothetical protein